MGRREPGCPMEAHGPGRPTWIHGDRDSPTSTDGQSGEGRTGGPDCGRDQALMKSQEKSERVGACLQVPYPSSYDQQPTRESR